LADNQNVLDLNMNFNIFSISLPSLKDISSLNDFYTPIIEKNGKKINEDEEKEFNDDFPIIIINPFEYKQKRPLIPINSSVSSSSIEGRDSIGIIDSINIRESSENSRDSIDITDEGKYNNFYCRS